MNVDNYIDSISEDIIKSTQKLITIASVKSNPIPNKPFGENISDVLDYMLSLGDSMEFKTKNMDGYVGYIEYGEGEELIGVLAHLDVVPEGSGWTYPPFGAEIHDNKIYGRGAIDDKGPAMSVLYAMKALKENNIKLNKRVRLILGLDEESGWECINYYKDNEEIPSYSFTPDADYPVIHAEKGIVNYKFYHDFDDKNNMPKTNTNTTSDIANENFHFKIISIKGGNRPNMVADFCQATLEISDNSISNVEDNLIKLIESNKFDIELTAENNNLLLKSNGTSSHGSTPEKGVNAISQLITILSEYMVNENMDNPFIEFYNNCIGLETDGSSMRCNLQDEVSGNLTFNVGLIEYNLDSAEIIVNIRYPVTFNHEQINSKIEDTIQKYDIKFEMIYLKPPLCIDKNHPLVQKLMKVYADFTGDYKSQPKSIGGGTYARALDNAVAFGAAFPGDPELAHKKNEYISIGALINNVKIYSRAIYELCK